MKKQMLSKVALVSVFSTGILASVSASAGNLPAIDSKVTTTFDKSVIHGSLAHVCDSDSTGNTINATCSGPLAYDSSGNARFIYTGQIYAVGTNNQNGELTTLANQIGSITGEAAFPKQFVALSTAVNGLMTKMVNNTWDGKMPQFPAVVPWTCNHCDMTVGGKHYVSIVDVLNPGSQYYSQDMVNMLNEKVADFDQYGNPIPYTGADAVFNDTRMKGRAFTAFGPASFDPASRTMGVRMAGCSALVNLTDMTIGTLCMNATAVFNVGETTADSPNMYGYDETSQISADGSSNCVTVMQPMQ